MIPEVVLSASLMCKPNPSRATSPAAGFVARQCDQSREHLQRSVYFGGVFDELCVIYEQCREGNWDGYGAAAIKDETYRIASRFLESLSLRTPTPSVGAEADGELALEWYVAPRRTLSVSVGPDGYLHYAALFNDSKAFGTEPFVADVPPAILNLIQQVYAA
ncbi:MAG: hypothetical protein ABSA67_14085 [Candidatus Brocadiia bacterium]|jgi:hypothetical protein